MRHFMIAIGIALLAACSPAETPPVEPVDTAPIESDPLAGLPDSAPDVSLPAAHYADGWAVTDGWPGEYPQGFSILADGVAVHGRTSMDPLADPIIACPLPKFATYQPWNFVRVEADNLEFVVATRLFDIIMTEDAEIEVATFEIAPASKTLTLKPADVLTYKRYIGEGFAIIAHDGVDYEINELELRDVSDIDTAAPIDGKGEDLWVKVTCADAVGRRAWLLYDEVISAEGVGPTPITGYGESADITEDDLADIAAMMAVNDGG